MLSRAPAAAATQTPPHHASVLHQVCAAAAAGGAHHAADIAALLLRAGADAEARNAGGQTAGEVAEAIGALGLATLLAQVGLNAPSVPAIPRLACLLAHA